MRMPSTPRRNLQDATRAKEKAEAALAALDRREAELIEQNRRFNAALGNMSQGLCMFDRAAASRLQRPQYRACTACRPSWRKPGTTFRRSSKRASRTASIRETPEQYLNERLAAAFETEPNTKMQEMSDGRIIAIKHQPMEHGGWVATHEDITQLRRIEARMSHMSRHDALTDLPNRVQLRERMEEALDALRARAAFR